MLAQRHMTTSDEESPASPDSTPGGPVRRDRDFTETQWGVVKSASGQEGAAAAKPALDYLCRRYWPPIYAFLRREGYSATDAEDLTQGFFEELFSTDALSRADEAKGRFRNFLLGALQRFLVDQLRHKNAIKRGRGKVVLAGDFAEVERQYLAEADPALTAEKVFDRRWAATVLEMAKAELATHFTGPGQAKRFAVLQDFLDKDGSEKAYRKAASIWGTTMEAVAPAVCRLRGRYNECIRRIVLATVSGPEEVDPEFAGLFG